MEEKMTKKTGTIIALTGLAAATMHIINRVEFSLSTVNNVLSNPDNKYYEWRFGKIRYTQKGSGTPLLLLHDLTAGSSSYEFCKIIDELAEKHEVYAVDLLGYGLSDKPNITYTSYLYVQSIIDFIKNVIGKKTDILATGDSSSIAVMCAHNDGEVIDRIVIINPQSINQLNRIPSKRTKLLKLLIDTPVLGTFVYNMVTTKEAFRKLFAEKYFYNPGMISEGILDAYREASHQPDCNAKYTFASYMGRYMNTNIVHALKQIDHSIYIIYGTEKLDNQTTVDTYLSYNQSIEAFSISYTRQYPHLEKSKAVLDQLEIIL